jgi:hypothetical protein
MVRKLAAGHPSFLNCAMAIPRQPPDAWNDFVLPLAQLQGAITAAFRYVGIARRIPRYARCTEKSIGLCRGRGVISLRHKFLYAFTVET